MTQPKFPAPCPAGRARPARRHRRRARPPALPRCARGRGRAGSPRHRRRVVRRCLRLCPHRGGKAHHERCPITPYRLRRTEVLISTTGCRSNIGDYSPRCPIANPLGRVSQLASTLAAIPAAGPQRVTCRPTSGPVSPAGGAVPRRAGRPRPTAPRPPALQWRSPSPAHARTDGCRRSGTPARPRRRTRVRRARPGRSLRPRAVLRLIGRRARRARPRSRAVVFVDRVADSSSGELKSVAGKRAQGQHAGECKRGGNPAERNLRRSPHSVRRSPLWRGPRRRCQVRPLGLVGRRDLARWRRPRAGCGRPAGSGVGGGSARCRRRSRGGLRRGSRTLRARRSAA
jgi:hypothetical protein